MEQAEAVAGHLAPPQTLPDQRRGWLPAIEQLSPGLTAVTRTEAIVVLLAAAGVFAIYLWSTHYWLDLLDEGYFLYLSSRVQAGDLPYRDFDTYYTPGVFYLYAWLFDLFGTSVEPVRVLMSGVRVLWALLLYVLARRVMSWPFAILPFLMIAGIDGTPVFPEPHPAWIATLSALAATEALARHLEGRGKKWIVVAGALAGLDFAFKQNAGAFLVLAIGGYLLLCERPPAERPASGPREIGKLLVLGQAGYVLVLATAFTGLLWPWLSNLLAGALLLPVIAILVVVLWSAWSNVKVTGWTTGLPPIVMDAILAGAAFVAVTLLWLIPMTLALGFRNMPWGLFVGAVNQGALILPLERFSPGSPTVFYAAIWLPVLLSLLGGLRWARFRWVLLGAVLVTALVPFTPVGPPYEDRPPAENPDFYPWLGYVMANLGTLSLYLPAFSAWAGVGMLGRAILLKRPVQPMALLMLSGGLAVLSLYPRVDVTHVMFAAPILFITGAWALYCWHRTLVSHANIVVQTLVYLSLLLIPAAAMLPDVYWRYVTIMHADPRSPLPPPYVELGLERAEVWLPEHIAVNVRGAVQYVQAGTPPGEPFFAYPVVPLFNFLAERPNPTRFNHFIANALTAEDLQNVINDLERSKPRYVLWDHAGVVYFAADLTNMTLHDYIWGCYQQVANYPPYLILERRCP